MAWSLSGANALIVTSSVAAVVTATAAAIGVIHYRDAERIIDRTILSSRCRQLAVSLGYTDPTRIGIIRNECEAIFAPSY